MSTDYKPFYAGLDGNQQLIRDSHYRPQRLIGGHNRIISAYDNFLSTDWAAVSGYSTLEANDDPDSVLFSDAGSKVTGVDPAANNYTLMLWRAKVLGSTKTSFRLVYRVFSQGAMTCTASSYGLQFYLSQDDPADASPNVYAQYANLPVTEGFHDVIWNSAYWALQGTAGGYNLVNPSTGVMIRSRAINGDNDAVVVFDRLESWSEDDTAAWFLLGFDDQHVNQIPAIQYAIGHGVPVYIAVNPTNVGATNYMTWDQLKRFHRTGMVQMCQHLDAFPYTASEADKRAYLRHSRWQLESHGLVNGADVYIIPSGTDGLGPGNRPSQADIELMRQYATVIRGTQPHWSAVGSDVELLQIGNVTQTVYQPKTSPHAWWKASYNLFDTAAADIEDYLEHAKTHGALMACHAHMFELAGSTDLTQAALEAMIDDIVAIGSDVQCKTFYDLIP